MAKKFVEPTHLTLKRQVVLLKNIKYCSMWLIIRLNAGKIP